MKSAIHRDLRKTETRESQLWFLTLGLLILFGGLIAVHDSISLLIGAIPPDQPRTATHQALTALFGLIVLFCLYVLQTLVLNGRLKGLLAEMGSLAASSKELDGFLPSIAGKIARVEKARTCQIALLGERRRTLRVRSAFAGGKVWQDQVGKILDVETLPSFRRAIETRQPVVLERADIAELSVEDRGFLLGGRSGSGLHSIALLPLVADDRILGVISLGRARGLFNRRFGASSIAVARTLANHAATAIDQAQLKRQAIHDPLTNLYNRRHLSERLRHEIAKAVRSESMVALLLCDLDRFKAVNDTQGHQVGDELLRAVAKSVQESTRGTDLVFRWGGDEIVVVLSESTREGTLTAARRIREGVLRTGETHDLDIDVSVGIAIFPDHGKNENELIRVADRALYIAKKSGDNVRIGEEDYQLDRSAIKVVFQPVVEIPSNRVVGYEALSRDPAGKLTVVELFDKYRAIGRLKELKQITLQSQIEVARELDLERVFINADFSVLSQIDPLPKPPGMDVVIELSEHEALHDLESHLSVAQQWRDAGYNFALDDFGAGFISFPFLATLVPEYIKVDRSTMLQAVSSEKFKGFLASLLDAVRGYATAGIIAEGVEQEIELQMVRDMGVTLVQGYFFGKPKELTRETVEKEGSPVRC